MILSAHQPQYIPWIGYFDKLQKSDCFVFLDQVQYKDREYQNRNKIRTKDGWMWLTVPVASKGKGRQRICDISIDNGFPWARQHLKSLKTCYGRSKFFQNFHPFFEKIYSRNWQKLVDLNLEIIRYLLKELSISQDLYFESDLRIVHKKTERIIEICRKIKADTYLSGIGAKAYIEEEKFVQAGIKLTYQNFVHPVYCQQFSAKDNDFIPNLSILDLLFNVGTDKAKEILK